MIPNGTSVIVNQGGTPFYGNIRGSNVIAEVSLVAIEIDFERSPHLRGYDSPIIILPEELVDIETPNIIHVDFTQWH